MYFLANHIFPSISPSMTTKKVPESSSWSSASVGRATATLQKVTPETWEQQDLLGWMC